MARLTSLVDPAIPFAVQVGAMPRAAEQVAADVPAGAAPELPARTGELAGPVRPGRTFRKDLDFEAHRRFIHELLLIRSGRTASRVVELHGRGAVTGMVAGSRLLTVGGRERTVTDVDAIAAGAGLVPTGVSRGRQGPVLLESACASC